MLETTPWLLIQWNEPLYLEAFKSMFISDNKVVLPDSTKPLIIYLDKDKNIYHIWRGGGYAGLREEDFNFNEPKFYRRAQRIYWIKYILENPHIRKIYKDKNNGFICFVSIELEYTVVLKELKTSFLLITAYHTYDPYSYMNKENRFERINTI